MSLTRPGGRPGRRRWRRLARWGKATVLGGPRYFLQRVPLYRRDRDHDEPGEPPPDARRPLPGDPESLQTASDGTGGLFHRRYCISVTDEQLTPEQLITRILADLNHLTPTELASFERSNGEPAKDVCVGDELVVRLPGPWDGPIRVIDRTPRSFRFATLRGHMEAGEIEFRAGYDERGFLRFEIESWARSGDRLFGLLYERFPLGREMQLHLWSHFCQRAAALAGGVRMSNVTCSTRRLE